MLAPSTWQAFTDAEPAMARAGNDLIHQYGIGLAFIATVRRDGGPRLHPCCPLLHDGHLYVFVTGASPKCQDLQRDGRYALHAFLPEETDDEFYCTGPVRKVADPGLRATIAAAARHQVQPDEVLFELLLERALHTTWERPRQPDTRPIYRKWRTPQRSP